MICKLLKILQTLILTIAILIAVSCVFILFCFAMSLFTYGGFYIVIIDVIVVIVIFVITRKMY